MAKAPAKKADSKAAAGGKGAAAPEPELSALPQRKKFSFVPIIAAVAGIALGGAATAGYFTELAPEARKEKKRAAERELRRATPETIKIDRMVVPLVSQQGTLAGYMTMEMMIFLDPDQSEFVKVRLPLVRHAINEVMATVPMTLPPDEVRLDFAKASAAFTDAANKALEEKVVRTIKIVAAVPL
jgi:flagellar basal body-associated protein FliL